MSQNNAARSNTFSIPADEIDKWMGQPVPRARRPDAKIIKITESRTPPSGMQRKLPPFGPNSRRR